VAELACGTAYFSAWLAPGIHPSHGDWIRLLREEGFVVEAVRAICTPSGSEDHPMYEIVSAEWATKWPAEELWLATRGGELRRRVQTSARDSRTPGYLFVDARGPGGTSSRSHTPTT
jgi:hypothetical protein